MRVIHIPVLLMVSALTVAQNPYRKYPELRKLKDEGFRFERIVTVSTIEGFIEALGSHTVIIVEPGEYVFTDSYILGSDENKAKLDNFDTLSVHYDNHFIHDINHMVVLGTGDTSTFFIQPDTYNHVMKFRNVSNLYIGNLSMGHRDAGWCMGGVLLIHNGNGIRLDRLELFGSGTEGLSLIDLTDLHVTGTTVTRCSEQLSSFSHVEEALFENCKYIDNQVALRGFAVYRSNIEFRNCTIEERYPYQEDPLLYDNDYDVLFLLDDYDFANWYINRDTYPADSGSSSSVIGFVDTRVNGMLVNHRYDMRDTYEEEEYYYEPIPIEFEELSLIFEDLIYYPDRSGEKESLMADTAVVWPEIGETPENKHLQVLDTELRKIKKVEQQYETAAILSPIGSYPFPLECLGSFESEWISLDRDGEGAWITKGYTEADRDRHPDFTRSELLECLRDLSYPEFASQVENAGENDYSLMWFKHIHRISFRITGITEDRKQTVKVIHVWMPYEA